MRSRLVTLLFALLSLACSATGVAEGPSSTLEIDGDVPARTLTLEDLQQLGAAEVEWTHRGETRKYRAVPLEAVLRSAGVEPGAMGPDVPPPDKRPAGSSPWWRRPATASRR